jgi:hypothetical protein
MELTLSTASEEFGSLRATRERAALMTRDEIVYICPLILRFA